MQLISLDEVRKYSKDKRQKNFNMWFIQKTKTNRNVTKDK